MPDWNSVTPSKAQFERQTSLEVEMSPSFSQRISIWLAKRHLVGQRHQISDDELTGLDWQSLLRRHLDVHVAHQDVLDHFYWTPSLIRPLVIGIFGSWWTFFSLPVAIVAGVVAGLMGSSWSTGLLWAGAVIGGTYILQLVWSTGVAVRQMFVQPRTIHQFTKLWEYYYYGDKSGVSFWGPYTSMWWRPGGENESEELAQSMGELFEKLNVPVDAYWRNWTR